MKKNNTEGYVAVWVCGFKSESDLQAYMKVHYEDDTSENIDSQFEKDFGLKYYDRELIEVGFLQEYTHDVQTLFAGSSYLESYITSLVGLESYITAPDGSEVGYNAIIRVYDYKYAGEVQYAKYQGNIVKFYGNLEYEKVVDLSWMGL